LSLPAKPHSLREHLQHTFARRSDGVQRPGLDEALKGLRVNGDEIHTRAQVEQVGERTALLTGLEDGGNGALTHVLDCVQPEANTVLDHPEVHDRLIDVRGKHLDAHLVCHRHVERYLVLGVHDT